VALVRPHKHRYLDVPAAGDRARGTLVLLHAFPLNARMWEPQLPLASHGWRVIAPHLRGFGGGVDEADASSVDDYAGDVIDLLDSLHITDAVIGGLSMGGYVAFALLRRAPSYVRGLVLADTRSQADTPEGVENRKKVLKQLTDAGDRGPSVLIEDMLPKLLGAATLANQPDVVARIRGLAISNPPAAIAGGIRALMTRPDSTPLLRTIHCPTLIVVGADDALTPPSFSQEMHQAIAGSELVIVPGAGHLSSVEQPAAFNSALAAFLTHRV
jgi:pimeloyl-ACP methyl ester carboxylesterase